MHRLFSSCPNFNPPAVTTGVGPQGRNTVHYQAPTEVQRAISPVIDPALIGLTAQPPLAPTIVNKPVASDVLVALAVPVATDDKENDRAAFTTPTRVPKSSAFGSTQLDDAVRKARGIMKPLSAKRGSTVEDAFTQMSRSVLPFNHFTI